MTDLTDKWKKGKLEEYKRYYCKTKWFEDVFEARCYNKGAEDEWWALENEKYKYNNIYHTKNIEVLAPVPSYEEWQAKLEENAQLKKWCEEFNALEVAKENAQLKELLKECQNMIAFKHEVYEEDALIKEIYEVLGEKK